MSKIKLFMEQLKADLTVEAFQTIKDELSERARLVNEEISSEVAASFKLKKMEEKKDDKKDDDTESEEEKEAKKGKDEADMDKKD